MGPYDRAQRQLAQCVSAPKPGIVETVIDQDLVAQYDIGQQIEQRLEINGGLRYRLRRLPWVGQRCNTRVVIWIYSLRHKVADSLQRPVVRDNPLSHQPSFARRK